MSDTETTSIIIDEQYESVRPRYNQTNEGGIPEKWEVKLMSAITSKIMVGIASAATHAYRETGVPLIRNQNIKPGFLDDQDILYVAPEYELNFKNKRLQAGDILIARTGYPGTACVVPSTYDSAQSFTTLIARPDRDAVDSTFLCQYINSIQGQLFFEQNQIGGGQKNVNAGSLQSMPILLPPLSEQRKIADILSTWDQATETTTELIDACERRKRGLMQRLLNRTAKGDTATYRAWKKERFGNIFSLRKIRNKDNRIDNVITVGKYAIRKQLEHFTRSVASKNLSDYWVITPGDFVYDPMSAYYGAIGRYELDEHGVVSPVYRVLKCDPRFSSDFMKYLLKSHAVQHELDVNSTQGNKDGKRRGLRHSAFDAIEVWIPELTEQTRIASILLSCDEELNLLGRYRIALQDQKKALMQNLLTGRLRVPVEA